MEKIYKVCANVTQDFTEIEKARARNNIGAAAASDIPEGLPAYTSSDENKTLVVGDQGASAEWAWRLRGRFIEDDGQGGSNSYDVKTLTINVTESSRGLVRMWPDGKGVQVCGWLAPSYTVFDDAGKVLTLNSDATGMEWKEPRGELKLLQNVTVNIDDDATVTIEEGKAYNLRITQSCSPIITLTTASPSTVHSFITLRNESGTSCANVKLRFNDETGYRHDIQFSLFETTAEYDFYIDIRDVGSTVIARLHDLPCTYRQGWMGSPTYTSDTAWIGYAP